MDMGGGAPGLMRAKMQRQNKTDMKMQRQSMADMKMQEGIRWEGVGGGR